MNTEIAELYRNGKFQAALSIAEKAVAFAREKFGPRHPVTAREMNDLGVLLQELGQYSKAELLHREALNIREKTYGPRDMATLTSMNNLAQILRYEGQYSESEALERKVLAIQRADLGDKDRVTLTTLNNLGIVLHDQGRYGEAEAVFSEALKRRREEFGDYDLDTLTTRSQISRLFLSQGRTEAAIEQLTQVLGARRAILGPEHPSSLGVALNLASALQDAGNFHDAEAILREILPVVRRVFGRNHLVTMQVENNLVTLLQTEFRYQEAEPLARDVFKTWHDNLGADHPQTLTIMNNLAMLLAQQSKFEEAHLLFVDLIHKSEIALGPLSPDTLLYYSNAAKVFVSQSKYDDAVSLLKTLEPRLLTWMGSEFYTTQSDVAKRNLVTSQETYQDLVLGLALMPASGADAAGLAASAVLHFKSLAVEEEMFLAHLQRGATDESIRQLATEITGLHNRLARIFASGGSRDEIEHLSQNLATKELELGKASRRYAETLQVRNNSPKDIPAAIGRDTAVLEIRQYRAGDFVRGIAYPPRWAGILITRDGQIVVRDLGVVSDTVSLVQAVIENSSDSAEKNLYAQLILPFAREISEVERLYIAPDGILYLVPFGALLTPEGHRLLEVKDVRLVQTGRDLLRVAPERQGQGLVAMGGIDFGPAPASGEQAPAALSDDHLTQATSATQPALAARQVALNTDSHDGDGLIEHLRTVSADLLRGGFGPLPHSKEEVEGIGLLYGAAHPDEPPPEVITEDKATKASLRSLGQPPRVLHLATHGFYRAAKEPADRPMLLSGIALAGANRALHDAGQDGILYAIEALDLNLEGTELVVLSACETAQGQIDYGEGVSGLVRALRTAGARNVLVTLRPVDDEGAANFMQLFYHHWLSQEHDDPAAALRDTQRDYLKPSTPLSNDPIWSNFILVGG
jgi:CHAT domain-containing protein/tetratricopeptide (TPR) repeat protein